MAAASDKNLLSKIAGGDQHGEDSPYFDGWKAYEDDPFHPTRNPHGVIQMGLAENQLCSDLIKEWIKVNPHASICTSEGVHDFSHVAVFQDYHGLPEFRQAIARFMGKARGGRVRFEPERVVMSGGATGANETLMFCLADPGDAFLVPTPYYAAFDRDLRWRTGVRIIPVECYSSNDFRITRQALESSYLKARESGTKVKGLILSNPSNPLGTTLDGSTLETLVGFVNDKQIHLVCDEIYAATVFSAAPKFTSVAEIVQDMDHHGHIINRDLIHIVCSLSKDMGLPGFRVGIIYSFNDAVVSAARKMSSFGLVSSQTQSFLAALLSDERFVDDFMVQSSKRLANRHGVFTKGLEEMGISCLTSNAGLFVWMDLRPMLKDQSFESEMALWNVIVNKVRINVSPGSSFHCSEPGWFRVCFANMDEETLHVGLRRIREFVLGNRNIKKTAADNKTRGGWQRNLRLSPSSRIYEEHALSPRLLSPHSPLLRA
ncbi:PREDICTED: 1-aminocyclopropane-1-carboxylate synthase-like protein 1 isoform X2 [Tarenaya hassleriana]|uniref:1-aminocyclopropane-1-carboxylate synthase-like protein 1 isoform X2 n=1 Tax=Tarenaya hassleriana TaxID=28532 RepID=UPI00053C816F|nr:PREDICTED: 1-aminocyclopropane-1-carboxylate synthase-like protein 1 isoform X2 [Tarenaya hassleriana]